MTMKKIIYQYLITSSTSVKNCHNMFIRYFLLLSNDSKKENKNILKP